MRRRFLEALGVAALTMAVVLVLKFARAPVSAQTGQPQAASKAGPAPVTLWGEPDLQGIWTRDSDEPLQRPAKYADKESLTDEERVALDNQISAIVGREAAESRRRRGTEQDVGGAYNAAIFTSHLRTGRRTSMIIDPPDGRIPAITAEEQKKRNELREYSLALLQATDVCKNKLPACAGGKYGPPSPRRAETPPYYIMNAVVGSGGGAISRSDGPEDRGHGERCMAAGHTPLPVATILGSVGATDRSAARSDRCVHDVVGRRLRSSGRRWSVLATSACGQLVLANVGGLQERE